MARMKTMILLSAIPGSGKSTWAKRYQKEHPNTHIVASDEVRKRISGGTQVFTNEPLVWETFLNDLNSFANQDDVTVIADATNLQNRYRRYYLENTPAYDRHILVLFNTPFEICLEQNRHRSPERIVPDHAMVSLYEEYEEPTQEILNLYDEVIRVEHYE